VYAKYEVSFTVRPVGVLSGWTNVLHITAGNRNNQEMGDRIPSVFFHSESTKLHISTGCNGQHNTYIDPPDNLPLGKDTQITIRVYDDVFTVHYDDREVGKKACANPFEPLCGQLATVYLSNPWYTSSNAVVGNVVYSSASELDGELSVLYSSDSGYVISPVFRSSTESQLEKGRKISNIEVYAKYEVSFTVRPVGVLSGWTNVLHITAGNRNNQEMGDRIPSVFFHSESTKLHISTGCNGRHNTYIDPPDNLPLGKDTQITIRVYDDVFTVHYNDREVGKIACAYPFEPLHGQLAAVYLSNPWYASSNAIVGNLVYSLATKGLHNCSKACYE